MSLHHFSQALCDVGRGVQYRKKYSVLELAESIGSVSWLEYDISRCKYVSLLFFLLPIDVHSPIIKLHCCAVSDAMGATW